MMTLEQALRQRRSVRAFLPQQVPDATLRDVFNLAQLAPSNCNTQPWVVHVASGASCERLRHRLTQAGMDPSQHLPDFPYDGRYPGVYRERQVDAAAQLYGAMGIAREDKLARGHALLANYAFFGAPHVAFICLPDHFGLREAADCGIYAQALMLALTAKGLASCPQAAVSFPAPAVRQELGLPEGLKVLMGVSFGYEDPEAPANRCRVGRANLDAAVTFHA